MSGRAKRRMAPLPPLYDDLQHWGPIQAEAIGLLLQLPDNSIDACATDPPYWIGFRGERWDGGRKADGDGFQAFTTACAIELRRVLKPGACLAAFGASRTVHRLVADVEDAGPEVRDRLLWLYGSTCVPKSRRLPGGLGSALKPAYEPSPLARRPLERAAPATLKNIARHGTGALNINAARIARPVGEPEAGGFWPPNVALSHEPTCRAAAAAGPNPENPSRERFSCPDKRRRAYPVGSVTRVPQ
jgi:hypothetical protein